MTRVRDRRLALANVVSLPWKVSASHLLRSASDGESSGLARRSGTAPSLGVSLLPLRRNVYPHAAPHLHRSGTSLGRRVRLAVILLSVASFFALGQSVAGKELSDGDSQVRAESTVRITVRLYNYARVPRQMLDRAEKEASTIFVNAGIQVEWVDCPLTEAQNSLYPTCRRDLGAADFVLRLLPESMIQRFELRDTTFGFALSSSDGEGPYFAHVLWDRIADTAQGGDLSAYKLLGHVAAHEIGHLLLGSIGHARTGLMSASWGPSELKVMARTYLLFTARQRRRMRAEALARMSRQELGARPIKLAGRTH